MKKQIGNKKIEVTEYFEIDCSEVDNLLQNGGKILKKGNIDNCLCASDEQDYRHQLSCYTSAQKKWMGTTIMYEGQEYQAAIITTKTMSPQCSCGGRFTLDNQSMCDQCSALNPEFH